jgi:hypothetical protein
VDLGEQRQDSPRIVAGERCPDLLGNAPRGRFKLVERVARHAGATGLVDQIDEGGEPSADGTPVRVPKLWHMPSVGPGGAKLMTGDEARLNRRSG